MIDPAALLTRLPDGTVKQHNPFTGTQVWTMPGRGKRPLPTSEQEVVDLPEGSDGLDGCAFCPGHHLDNPPEKARLVGEDDGYRTITGLAADELDDTEAAFRRVPNLFEICSPEYWRLNHGVLPGRGVQARALALNPQVFNTHVLDVAIDHGLVLAANDHAVAFAGFGHRYPSIEVYSLSPRREPWLLSGPELDGLSDVLHAMHAAGGPQLSCNEEWHHRPPSADDAMPWRIVLKWRISTLAGFEGATKIYLNTLSPWDVRDRVLRELHRLRDEGAVGPELRIGDECRLPHGAIPW